MLAASRPCGNRTARLQAGWTRITRARAEAWTKLFRQTFRFTGGQIVGEFLMSVGYLPGAHEPDCPVFSRILEQSPPWARAAALSLSSD